MTKLEELGEKLTLSEVDALFPSAFTRLCAQKWDDYDSFVLVENRLFVEFTDKQLERRVLMLWLSEEGRWERSSLISKQNGQWRYLPCRRNDVASSIIEWLRSDGR
jgi:hypothetical protein